MIRIMTCANVLLNIMTMVIIFKYVIHVKVPAYHVLIWVDVQKLVVALAITAIGTFWFGCHL